MRLTAIVAVLLLVACNVSSVKVFFDVEKDVFFKLYKRDNPTNFTILNKNSSGTYPLDSFDPNIPTRICIHGYLAKKKSIDRFREAYLNVGDFKFINYILVDWTKGAFNVNYYVSKGRITLVANKLAKLINALVEKGMNLKDLTMVGHSLGAHMAGLAAKRLNSTEKVGIIVGLDPASFGFTIDDAHNRLAKSDADYVQVLHTDIKMYGFSEPIGHADIYSHRGQLQPGCLNVTGLSVLHKCSHARAYEIFFESLKSDFVAIKCASYKEIQQNRCTFDNVTTIVGGKICATPNKPHGQFYMETNRVFPFALSDFNMFKEININSHLSAELQLYQGSPIYDTLEPKKHKPLMDIFNSVKEKVLTAKSKIKQNEIQMEDLDGMSTQQNDRKGFGNFFKWPIQKNPISELTEAETAIQLDESEMKNQKSKQYKKFINWVKDMHTNVTAIKTTIEEFGTGIEMMNDFA